jgi:hypothetical protein
MKARLLWLFTAINLILLVSSASAHDAAVTTGAPLAAPFGTSFTYQGRLRSSNRPFNGSCDFQFSLWNALNGGASLGGIISKNNTPVSDGRFTVQLDFGAVFDGNGRWLQIAVRCPTGSGGFTSLTPRQALSPSPYAVNSTTASSVPWSGITGKPAGFADNVDNGVSVPLNLSGSSANPILVSANSGTGRAGQFNNASGSNPALFGGSTGANGTGVLGRADTGTDPYGLWGLTLGGTGSGPRGAGVAGWQGDPGSEERYFSTVPVGVLGTAVAPNGIGVFGLSTHYRGVEGYSQDSFGVQGYSINSHGIYGSTGNASAYAGFFSGNINVTGSVFGAANISRIDHPLDPANKYLSHTAVESAEQKNIYDGVVTLDADGAATVTLPSWFEALNQDFRYQLTAIGAPGPDLYIAQEIQGNHFAIAGGKPGTKVSWQVTGIRHDPYAAQHRLQVESAKAPQERGKYLYPRGYGQPETQAVDYAERQGAEQAQLKTSANSKTP